MKSRPRPIHLPPRQPLNEKPDATEPKSYEEESFFAYDREDDVVDEFHRQFAASSSSSGRHNHGGRLIHNPRGASSSEPGSGSDPVSNDEIVGGGSNFWRTTSRNASDNGAATAATTDKVNTERIRNNATNDCKGNGFCGNKNTGTYISNNPNKRFENRSYNGLRGGVRRLRSSGKNRAQNEAVFNNNHQSDMNHHRNAKSSNNNKSLSKKNANSNSNHQNKIHNTREKQPPVDHFGLNKSTNESANDYQHRNTAHQKYPKQEQQHQISPTIPFHQSVSASSLGSTGSNSKDGARMKSKQRDEVRRLKFDAQQQLGDDGGIVDNGYYTEVPTVNHVYSHRNRRNDTNSNNKGSNGRDRTMSALEEEMSGDVYTTDDSNDNYDNSVDNDGSHTFLHSNYSNCRMSADDINTTYIPSPSYQEHQRLPSSTMLVSAADSAAAAASDYRSFNNRRDDRTPSLTHHINNIRESSSTSHHQQQHHQIPIVFALSPNDNTDNRSTTSTLSDLSLSESNVNHHYHHHNQHQQQQQQQQQHYNNIINNHYHHALGSMTRGFDGGSMSAIGNNANPNANLTNKISHGIPVLTHSSSTSSRLSTQHEHQFAHRQHFPNVVGGDPANLKVTNRVNSSGLTSTKDVQAFGASEDDTVGNPTHNFNQKIGTDETGSSIIGNNTIASAANVLSVVGDGSRRLQATDYNRHSVSSSDNASSTTRKILTNDTQLQHKIALLLDACETIRFPFKKKLILNSLHMTAADIPVKDLYGTVLGQSLYKLSMSGNRLSTVPRKLVTCLPSLKSMDISQCELHQIPDRWNLPQLKRLNMSHNRLCDFPEETMLEGLPELQELNMYGNKVSVIVVPHSPTLLARLEILNLGYNDLAYLPEELDRLKALKTLKVMNNFLEKIPMRICNMELKVIDVSSNPVIQPPIETCERGIGSMKRYYHCLSMEEQSKPNALEALQSKAVRHSKKQAKSKKGSGVGLNLNFSKPKRRIHVSLGRRQSDDTSSSHSSTQKSHSIAPAITPNHTRRKAIPDIMSLSPLVCDDPLKLRSISATSETHAPITMNDSTPSKAPKRSQSLQDAAIIEQTSRDKSTKSSIITTPNNILMETKSVTKGNNLTYPSKLDNTAKMEFTDNDSAYGTDQVTINNTLKVIFVGMAMAGKTSMIKRLIEGEDAVIPKKDDRTIGVDIYEWDPTIDKRYDHIDNRILLQDKELEKLCGNSNVKFSVWDFAGQHVYHATHELFFSPRALYVLVWDMGATNSATKQRVRNTNDSLTDIRGAFKLGYDSDDESDSDDDDFFCEEEARRADRALERDIDEKVQFWVDCIQSTVPGAAILPVASFDDLFEENDHYEAKRRCDILKERLLKHEERRIQGIEDRLKKYVEQNRANDDPALRLRKLLGSYTRPKIIFGNDGEDSVVRVSGTKYTGFAHLTEKINNIATGRDTANYRYPIFRGHVGARIPRMRLRVLDAARRMRDRFKVVKWGYFFQELQKDGIECADNVSDALHFLTNVGELSYFGDVLPDRTEHNLTVQKEKLATPRLHDTINDKVNLTDDDNDVTSSCLFGANSTLLPTEDYSTPTNDNLSGSLSQFVFLNPRWLVAAVACILRHDLDREIQETRRTLSIQQQTSRSNSFYEANMNCPVITSEDACMLWHTKRFTKKAAERAAEFSNDMQLNPFEFLQLLLVRFRVFIPIDLGIDKAFLGGKEYSQRPQDDSSNQDVILTGGSPSGEESSLRSTYFFLPSLLGPGEPTEAWTYKSTDSWKATLCHSIFFPEVVPPGLMERITASVLSNLYTMAHKNHPGVEPWRTNIANDNLSCEGKIIVKEVLCWRTAFLVKLGMQVQLSNGEQKESIVEIFTALVDRDSNVCVGSDQMSVGSRRLVTSGKGQEGDGGRKIWTGGYLVVVNAVERVMEEYGGLEFEKQAFCPECLSKKGVSEASCWDRDSVRRLVLKGDTTIRCRHGHKVDIRLVSPDSNIIQSNTNTKGGDIQTDPVVPINDILRSVVVVGLWDGKTKRIVRVGSGFIADKKRGLIVTASHTLMNIWGDKVTPFGENYYGMREGKVVIGIIPRKKGEESGTEAVFRYFAKIVAKDPEIDQGICHLDACVLRITTRMENDVRGTGEGCGDQIEHLLLNNPHAIKQEKLQQLKITDNCELDEQVRIIGYNQGGEGLMGPGVSLNRYVDFARGYVCKKFAGGEANNNDIHGNQQQPVRHCFKPREEIVVICPTISGHSGGPCVNDEGKVIGILSRADPAENQRCYISPTYEWRSLLRRAKKVL